MDRDFFGTDGVRGKANSYPMRADTVLKIGMAAGALYRRGKHRHRVVIGKDTRLSGYMVEQALTAGFLSTGMDVFLFGPVPTSGGGHADPLNARRPGRHAVGFAQPVS